MCGIAGVLAPRLEIARAAIGPMVAAQQHRGPDDSGEVHLPFGKMHLALGHRRLSILDLAITGHQPMVNPTTGDVLIFNGEVYNYLSLRRQLTEHGQKFLGNGDTEVLLHALGHWYTDALPRLQGMFAFAYYRAREKTLLLGRDSIGIKPLYISITDSTLVFASEVRAILASSLVPRKLERRGLATFLAYGAVQHPLTMVEGVYSLDAGNWQEVSASDEGFRISKPIAYWKYPTSTPLHNTNEVLQRIQQTMDDSVRDHLVSDVPVGIFLSSGIDSTIIAGLAARHAPDLHTFTVSCTDDINGEGPRAEQTARLFGLHHVTIPLPAEQMMKAILNWFERLDQPSIDGFNTYVISKAVREQGIKVALSGLGADELFGGYPSFRDVPRLHSLARSLHWLPSPIRRGLARLAAVGKSSTVRNKFSDMLGGNASFLSLYFQRRRVMSDDQLGKLGIEADQWGLSEDFMPREVLDQLEFDELDPVHAVSQLESQFYQGNMLLRDADANSMAHGLELRVPFLDQRLLEVAFRLPGQLRLPAGRPGKFLLREVFSQFLRNGQLRNPKSGFVLPISKWMLGPMRDRCEESIRSIRKLGILSAAGIDQVWGAFLDAPDSPIWTRALSLCVLSAYLRQSGLAV